MPCSCDRKGIWDRRQILNAQSEARKEENYINKDLHGMINKLESHVDGTLCLNNQSWISCFGELMALNMHESHKSKYSIHPRLDKMYQDLKKLYWLLVQAETPHWKWEKYSHGFYHKPAKDNKPLLHDLGNRDHQKSYADVRCKPLEFQVEGIAMERVKDPRERSFDDYKWMFDLEVDQLADEYELGIGKKGHMLDDIWENCKKVQGDNTYWWHDQKSEEEERRELGINIEEYDPPIVYVENFKIKRYSFGSGQNFISATKELMDALLLGRENGARFRDMIRKEVDSGRKIHIKT
ncbi:hypothetical protein Tco_0985757 [Tanacetum coccineum]